MSKQKTKDQILRIARDLLTSEGISAVSFDAIAQRLGRTKQAVLYWYPTKQDLLAAMFIPWLQAEAEVAARSVSEALGRTDAIRSYVEAIAEFHFSDLERFRMMYLLPQTITRSGNEFRNIDLLEEVHPVTDQIYTAIAAHLGTDPLSCRREAVAIHSAVLGLVLMFGLAESLHDPLKHSSSALTNALISSLCSQ